MAKKEKIQPEDKTKFMDQLLEDMAGDEFDDYEDTSKNYAFSGHKRTNYEESEFELHDL